MAIFLRTEFLHLCQVFIVEFVTPQNDPPRSSDSLKFIFPIGFEFENFYPTGEIFEFDNKYIIKCLLFL